MRILVVEDDLEMSDFVCEELRLEGHEVTAAHDGREGFLAAVANDFGMLVVDRMIPKMDGLAMVTALRSVGIETPVIFLTALGRVDERVEGLRSGGDDYLVKPFVVAELLARIDGVARRKGRKPASEMLRVGDLEVNRLSQRVTRAGRVISLKPKEYRLLEYMMQHAGKVVTKTMLLEAVWDFHFDPQTTLVESHISRIRAKIDSGDGDELIHTVWGSGYRIEAKTPK